MKKRLTTNKGKRERFWHQIREKGGREKFVEGILN